MEMIANAKLFKQRNRMEANREYAQRLQETVNEVAAASKEKDTIYLKPRKSERKFTILFCSDLGLCGGYNQNIKTFAKQNLNPEDPMIVCGTSLYNQMKEEGFNVLNKEAISSDALNVQLIRKYVEAGVDQFEKDEAGTVQLLYTKFVNTMSFEPSFDVLLPCEVDEDTAKKVNRTENGNYVETLFEPDPDTILSDLIPQMIVDVAYSDWLESTTSEQGSRRMAMKTATDNADDLSSQLMLEYNKARQAAITQEITEIVAGSSAV